MTENTHGLNVPEGFELFETSSPFNQMLGPYFCKRIKEKGRLEDIIFGLRVAEKHCNSKGKLHGGMIGAIADIAIGHNLVLSLVNSKRVLETTGAPIATVSMSTDYVGAAELGDWVEIRVDVQKAGRTLAFANAYLVCNEERLARVSAVFRVFI